MTRSLAAIEAQYDKKGKIHLEGYALLRSAGRAADGILVTTRSPDAPAAEPMIIDVGYSDELPAWLDINFTKDYHFILKNTGRPQRFGRWTIDLDRSRLPPGKQKIECWALDFKDGTVRRIGDGFFAGGP